MDTTTKYIKMCEMAREIQGIWFPQAGDYVNSLRDKPHPLEQITIDLAEMTPGGSNKRRIKNDMTFLPQQDRLQEMVSDKYCIHDMTLYFLDFVSEHAGCHPHEFPSDMMFETAEQLWLAFVMKEKFNKAWNEEKEEWVSTS